MKFVHILPMLALTACLFGGCSGDSSDNPASCTTGNCSTGQSSIANASNCPLATQRLPASPIAWQPTLGGSCEAAQMLELADLESLTNQLKASGWIEKQQMQGMYSYTNELMDVPSGTVTRDTLMFTYTMGGFAGTFRSTTAPFSDREKTTYLVAAYCPILLPPSFFDGKDVCATWGNNKRSAKTNDGREYRYFDEFVIKTNVSTFKDKLLRSTGWSCKTTNNNVTYNQAFDRYVCQAQQGQVLCLLEFDPPSATTDKTFRYKDVWFRCEQLFRLSRKRE